jgi:hypothetical protein
MNAIADIRAEPYDWLHFARRSGEKGQAWVEEYRRYAPTVALSDRALEQLRWRRFEEGQAILHEFAHALETLNGTPDSMRRVLDRWYHGVSAYYFYCIEDFDHARQSMLLAHEAVVEAISEADFLLLLAVHCQEFCLHQARIARNRRQWLEMHDHVKRARAMMLDQVPLCERRDGRPVFFSTLGQFFRSIESLSSDERQSIRGLVEEDERILLFDRFVRRLYSLPGFAIDYP